MAMRYQGVSFIREGLREDVDGFAGVSDLHVGQVTTSDCGNPNFY
jgi:hypothetical protein